MWFVSGSRDPKPVLIHAAAGRVIKDAPADTSDEEMNAALDMNIPNYATAIVTTNETVDAWSDK